MLPLLFLLTVNTLLALFSRILFLLYIFYIAPSLPSS